MANKNSSKNGDKEYARAPYNFIPFPEKIFYRHTILEEHIDKDRGITVLPKHNMFEKGLKTGYIDYLIKVETPLFISDGEKESDFFKVDGKYTIPGSTVRGKVRSNAEILSCSYPEFIENKKLWFRGAFSGDVLGDMYRKAVLPNETGQISDKVKAGYLTRKGDKWFITPAKQENNKFFKVIHESQLRNNHKNIHKNIKNNIFMYNFKDKSSGERLWDLVKEIKDEKRKINKKIKDKEKELSLKEKEELEGKINKLQNDINKLLKNNKRDGFKPYYYKASYNNQLQIIQVIESAKGENYGILMNSSRLDYKQNHYLIFKKDDEKLEKEISNKLINQYKTSVQYRNEKVEVENFKISEDKVCIDEKEKPIFYITDDQENIIAFGFTPYLKVPYEKSVWDGIKTKKANDEEVKKGKIDYAKGIFGFTNFEYIYFRGDKEVVDNISYKGRVSFTNAKSVGEEFKQVEKPILKHLMGPKISSFQLYLKQEDNNPKKLKTYSDDDFELRGKKFYWLRNKHDNEDDYEKDVQKCEMNKKNWRPKTEQYASLYAIDERAEFKGKIYFENLYEDELGLLLMSIKPFEDAKENLGQGKPYGYGKVNFQIEKLVEIDSEKRFTSLNPSSSEKSILKDKYVKSFIKYMKKQNVNVDFENENMYTCFAQSKLQEKDIENIEFNYMGINDFRSRKILKPMEAYIYDDEKVSKNQVAVAKEESYFDLDEIEKMLSSKYKTTRKN